MESDSALLMRIFNARHQPMLARKACRRQWLPSPLILLGVLMGCAATGEPVRETRHPDGLVLAHAEPGAARAEAGFYEDTRDIIPLRVSFPDWELPPGYADHVAVRAAQFMANAIRARPSPPPVSAWLAEKVNLAAAMAADTEGRFTGPPDLPRLNPDPAADAEAAYVAAFTAAVARYDAKPDRTLARQADLFRKAWLDHLAKVDGSSAKAIARGVARGDEAARLVATAYPALDPERLKTSPESVREKIAPLYQPLEYEAAQAWRFTPASGHLERRPFNDYVPVAPGVGLVAPLVRLGRDEGTVPPFPPMAAAHGGMRWNRSRNMVAGTRLAAPRSRPWSAGSSRPRPPARPPRPPTR